MSGRIKRVRARTSDSLALTEGMTAPDVTTTCLTEVITAEGPSQDITETGLTEGIIAVSFAEDITETDLTEGITATVFAEDITAQDLVITTPEVLIEEVIPQAVMLENMQEEAEDNDRDMKRRRKNYLENIMSDAIDKYESMEKKKRDPCVDYIRVSRIFDEYVKKSQEQQLLISTLGKIEIFKRNILLTVATDLKKCARSKSWTIIENVSRVGRGVFVKSTDDTYLERIVDFIDYKSEEITRFPEETDYIKDIKVMSWIIDEWRIRREINITTPLRTIMMHHKKSAHLFTDRSYKLAFDDTYEETSEEESN
jgi:hypothetical protein